MKKRPVDKQKSFHYYLKFAKKMSFFFNLIPIRNFFKLM